MKQRLAFLRHHPKIAILVVLLVIGASLTIAQIVDQPKPPAAFFPDGPLVYAEAQDLEQLLNWWRDSQVKASWEESSNQKQFQNSTLYLKLKDRMTKWGSGGKFSFNLNNLIQAAGSRSGIAIYDIGELKALAATRLPFSKAETTELWLARSRFQQKKSGNQNYYVEPREGSLVFAYVNPYLIVSTDESLLVRAIENTLASEASTRTLEQSEKWQKFEKQITTDVMLFLDQEALQQNRYFKKYWIHKNVAEFENIRAVWIDLKIEPSALVERRYFLQKDGSAASAELTTPDSLKAFQQLKHDTLLVDAPVTAADAASQIVQLINRLPRKDHKTSYPPAFSGASERATQAETRNILLEQIDEPVIQVKAETLIQASQEEELTKLLSAAEPVAYIRLSYPLWDNQALFARFPETSMIQFKNFSQLNQQSVLDQLRMHFLLLHSTQGEGAQWKNEGNGGFVLESFRPLFVKFQNPWLVLSTEDEDFRNAIANLPSSPTAPAGKYAETNWRNGRWKYTRLMQRLDHGSYQEDVPLLFSGNIASLLIAFDPIVASSVTQTSNQEVVRYELQ